MHGLLRERIVSILAVLGACAIVPAALLHFLGPREVHISAEACTSCRSRSAPGLAAAAVAALTVVGARRGDGRAVLVGTAFSVMAALLAVHGLTTPGCSPATTAWWPSPAPRRCPSAVPCSRSRRCREIRRPRSVKPLLWLQGVLLAARRRARRRRGARPVDRPRACPRRAAPRPGSCSRSASLFYGVARAARRRARTCSRAAAPTCSWCSARCCCSVALSPALHLGLSSSSAGGSGTGSS